VGRNSSDGRFTPSKPTSETFVLIYTSMFQRVKINLRLRTAKHSSTKTCGGLDALLAPALEASTHSLHTPLPVSPIPSYLSIPWWLSTCMSRVPGVCTSRVPGVCPGCQVYVRPGCQAYVQSARCSTSSVPGVCPGCQVYVVQGARCITSSVPGVCPGCQVAWRICFIRWRLILQVPSTELTSCHPTCA
jgi:hypothetical protein